MRSQSPLDPKTPTLKFNDFNVYSLDKKVFASFSIFYDHGVSLFSLEVQKTGLIVDKQHKNIERELNKLVLENKSKLTEKCLEKEIINSFEFIGFELVTKNNFTYPVANILFKKTGKKAKFSFGHKGIISTYLSDLEKEQIKRIIIFHRQHFFQKIDRKYSTFFEDLERGEKIKVVYYKHEKSNIFFKS